MNEPSRPALPRRRGFDVAIVGAGVCGLWAARLVARAGLSVCLIERSRIGAGASGGFLGALMPHMPERWNDKKAFQFEALVSLEPAIAALEADVGMSCGYRRVGRLLPLASVHLRDLALARHEAALWRWPGFSFDLAEQVPDDGWLSPAAAPFGVVRDTLSARLDPRRLLASLHAAIGSDPRVTLIEGIGVVSVLEGGTMLCLDDGSRLSCGHSVIAAGVDSFSLLDDTGLRAALPLGKAVKGQTALLEAGADFGDRPVLYRDGVYVVAHDGGRVAVGSTSETAFSDPASTDARLDAVVAAARDLCPALRDARIVERWAGLRPRAIGRDPMLGPMPARPRLIAMTGGFKITLGIAHRMAEAVVGMAGAVAPIAVPESFRTEVHLAAAQRP